MHVNKVAGQTYFIHFGQRWANCSLGGIELLISVLERKQKKCMSQNVELLLYYVFSSSLPIISQFVLANFQAFWFLSLLLGRVCVYPCACCWYTWVLTACLQLSARSFTREAAPAGHTVLPKAWLTGFESGTQLWVYVLLLSHLCTPKCFCYLTCSMTVVSF